MTPESHRNSAGASIPKTDGAAVGTPRLRLLVRRIWAFRLGAMLLAPLLALLLAEGGLRLAGFGYPTRFFLERRIDGQAVLLANPEFGKRFFPPGLARPPRPQTLPAIKPAGALRVIVFGESAAMGDPDPRFGLPRMLEVLLRERYTHRPVEVVNAAVVAINSHVVLPIARECAALDGDVWVVCMGNNERIGPFGPITVFGWQSPPLPLIRANLAVKSTRLGQALDALARAAMVSRARHLDWAGMSMMADQRLGPDDPRQARVHAGFEANLEALLDTAQRARVPVILCTVPTNLRDCAPFASLHRRGLAAADLAAWDDHFQRGTNLEARGDFRGADEAFRLAAGIDDLHAELAFRRAGCALQLGRTNEAGPLLRRARDCDALQFRTDSRINEVIRGAATRRANSGVRLLDAETLFANESPTGLSGREQFYEHVHFTPAGNYLLARAAADQVAGLIASDPVRPGEPVRADGVWLSEPECRQRLGFTDWHRHHILLDVLRRVEAPPFTGQFDHERDLRRLREQIEASRFATKPAAVRRASEQLTRLIERHPGEPDLHWVLAELLEAEGARAPAEAQWRELVRRLPLAAIPAFNLARLLAATDRVEEAAGEWRLCLEMDPDYFEARYELGVALTRLGRPAEAVRELERAVRRKPRSGEVRLAYALALRQARDESAARREFEAVLRLDPGNAEARRQLETR